MKQQARDSIHKIGKMVQRDGRQALPKIKLIIFSPDHLVGGVVKE